jgi:dihydroorotase
MPTTTTEIEIIAPSDFHHHLRDESDPDHGSGMLSLTCRFAAIQFQKVVVMPNLKPPIRTVDEAFTYRNKILDCLKKLDCYFEPLMTLYLTDMTSAAEIRKAKECGFVHAVKLYPAGATTNSEFGVTSLTRVESALSALEEVGLPLLLHGEVTDGSVDLFDREKVFIDTVLSPLIEKYPNLKVVLEHITTEGSRAFIWYIFVVITLHYIFSAKFTTDAVKFVESVGPNISATITAHHLLYNRNAIFTGGICPHMYCLPVLKRERHRLALLTAATSGNPKFFLGTDSAPHSVSSKESSCGCAGIFTGHAAIELYAEAFDTVGSLDKLENFASIFGPTFYGIEVRDPDYFSSDFLNIALKTTF